MDTTPLGNRGKPDPKNTKGSAPPEPAPKVVKRAAPSAASVENDDDDANDLPFYNPVNPPHVELPEIPPQNELPEIPPQNPAPKRAPWEGDANPAIGRALKERDGVTVALRALVAACAEHDEQNPGAKTKLTKGTAHRDATEVLKIIDQRAEADKKNKPAT